LIVDERAIREEIDRLQAGLDRLRALLPERDSAPAGDDPDQLIEVSIASERFGYPGNTVRSWCRQGDGKKVGGRWLVDVRRVQRRLG
jgi:hypothetical protein